MQPYDTGQPGGKETGQSISHYFIPGGHHTRRYAKLKAGGIPLDLGQPAGEISHTSSLVVVESLLPSPAGTASCSFPTARE